MKRIAIYSRKSIETDTGESIKNQIKFCKEYFRRHGDCTFEIFEDEGFSGGNTNRPSFQRMMDLVKFKQFDVVAVYKIDRIARNIVDFVNIFDELETYNVQLVSITEGFDPSTPAGKMMMLLLASFAEMERMNIAQRIRDNMNELAKLGRWSGGTPPKGYTTTKAVVNGKNVTYLKLLENEAFYVRECFLKYADGMSTYSIEKYLKEKYNVIYPSKTIYGILLNPTYLESSAESTKFLESLGYTVFGEPNGCGYLPYNRRKKQKGIKTWNHEDRLVGISTHDPIIDFSLWFKVQSIFKSRSNDKIKDKDSEISYLSSFVKCKCKAPMYIHTGKTRKDGTKKYYFRCSLRGSCSCNNRFLNVLDAESSFEDFLKTLTDKGKLEKHINTKTDSKDISKKIKSINKQISVNDTSINNLIDRLAMITVESAAKSITKKIEELSLSNNKLKEELLSLEREKLFQQRDNDNINIIHASILTFLNNDMTLKEKRNQIRTFIDTITWDSKTKELQVELLKIK